MGGSNYSKIPASVEGMKASEKSPTVEVEYCGAWGGYQEAKYTEKIIKHVYPNASVRVFTPGTTRDLIVRVGGKVAYQKKTNGGMNDTNALLMVQNI